MDETTLYIKNSFNRFNALQFCKKFSYDTKSQAISAVEASISQINTRNLKTKEWDKPLIVWARLYKRIKLMKVNVVLF